MSAAAADVAAASTPTFQIERYANRMKIGTAD